MITALKTRDNAVTHPSRKSRATAGHRVELPQVSAFLASGFYWYVARYVRKHFNAVRLTKGTQPDARVDQPVICFGNHPGWWDPLMAMLLHQLFLRGRTAYAPIDHVALAQYPIFRKLGFYGLDLESRRAPSSS